MFQDFGAKTFESLATQDQKMQMKHFASCVGVNNIECKTQEEEHDVVPVSCVSRGSVDSLVTSRRIVGGGVEMFTCYQCCRFGPRESARDPTYYEAKVPRANVLRNAHVWLKEYLL